MNKNQVKKVIGKSLLLLLVVLATVPVLAQRKNTVITLSRTACFGTCPSYTVTIHGDGTVEYEGHKFVKVEGKQTAKISPTSVDSLVKMINRIKFFSMKNEYKTKRVVRTDKEGKKHVDYVQPTDLPTHITTITLGRRTKTIKNYYNAPEALGKLEEEIDRVAQTAQWVRQEQQ